MAVAVTASKIFPQSEGTRLVVKLIFDSCLTFQKFRFNQINSLAKKKPLITQNVVPYIEIFSLTST